MFRPRNLPQDRELHGDWNFQISVRDKLVVIAILSPDEDMAQTLFDAIAHDITENNKIDLEVVGDKTIVRDDRRSKGTTLQ